VLLLEVILRSHSSCWRQCTETYSNIKDLYVNGRLILKQKVNTNLWRHMNTFCLCQ